MKLQIPIVIVMCLAMFASCKNDSKQELTYAQKETIIQEIDKVWQTAGKGIEELNAELAFSLFSKSKDAKYIRDGHLYPDIETAKKQYAGWFSDPNASKQKFSCDPIYYDIIDDKTVIMTTLGSIVKVNDDPNKVPWVLAYTIVWRKEGTGWKVFHMHNSWE
jgi:hypothetical protein